jgi:hypothetical protein
MLVEGELMTRFRERAIYRGCPGKYLSRASLASVQTERDFLETVKLWDFQEAFGPAAREKTAEAIFSLRQRLDAASPCTV